MGLEVILYTVRDFFKLTLKSVGVGIILVLGLVAGIAYLIGYLTR